MVRLGEAFFNKNSPSLPTHLYMVASDPEKNAAEVVLVNATTRHFDTVFDEACLLSEGDHPDIEHDSYMTYMRLKIAAAAVIDAGMKGGVLTKRQDLTSELLRKVQEGVMKSKYAPRKAKTILEDQGFVWKA